MRSVTSYFNPTIYRKTMHRNWPLWAVYGLFWLFAIPLRIFNDFTRRSRYDIIGGLQEDMLRDFEWLPDMLQMGVVVAVGYGVLCAMAIVEQIGTTGIVVTLANPDAGSVNELRMQG